MAHLENNQAAISACGKVEEKAPLTEPTIVNSIFLTGAVVEATDTCVRLVGWEEIATVFGEMAERRIVTRLVLTTTTAGEIAAGIRKALAKGGH